MSNHSFVAVVTVPGREFALEQCLQSLRIQADRLHVICHDMAEPPACVRALADGWRCEADLRGSAAKLHWASQHQGLYLGCDDDLVYPPDYVDTMRAWVDRWDGRALVTCHGRILPPESRAFGHVTQFWPPQMANPGAWINYPGGCALAFDTRRLLLPSFVPGKNLEEAHLAVWAQAHRVPIWLVPHSAGWLRYLLVNRPDLPTIWQAEKQARFANRNAVLATVAAPWEVFAC